MAITGRATSSYLQGHAVYIVGSSPVSRGSLVLADPATLSKHSKGNFIAVVGRLGEGLMVRRVKEAMRSATPLPVYSISAPSLIPGIDFSDQLNYWNAGYHAMMITDTAFYRNRNYHTEHDTPEKLDYKRMAMVIEGVFAAVMKLANE